MPPDPPCFGQLIVVALICLPALVQAIDFNSSPPAVESAQIEADWRRQDVLRQPVANAPRTVADETRRVLERGHRLANSHARLGAVVTRPVIELRELELALARPGLDQSDLERLHLRARWTVRAMALANPLLDFNTILFVKRAPTLFPHMSDQHYGWWSRPGGGVCLLEGFKAGSPRVSCLTEALPPGSFAGPDLSTDGQRILFAYARHYPDLAGERDKTDGTRIPEDAYYHLYELNAYGTGLRRLTRGRYDDFDGRYLPDGSIAFLSTRKGTSIQSTQATTLATLLVDLPMSYVRCGGDNWRPVPVFTLHRMDAEGAQLRPLSAFENYCSTATRKSQARTPSRCGLACHQPPWPRPSIGLARKPGDSCSRMFIWDSPG